jgi:hypothetical protein
VNRDLTIVLDEHAIAALTTYVRWIYTPDSPVHVPETRQVEGGWVMTHAHPAPKPKAEKKPRTRRKK